MGPTEAQKVADGLARSDPDAAFRAGIALLNADYPEILLPAAHRLSERHRTDARMAQLLGLAARATGEGPRAYAAFVRAARLAPSDPLIAHSHARTALEAGKPAVEQFDTAARLAPADGSVLLGLAAALVAERRAPDAIAHLRSVLARNPLWIDGHRSLAQIRGQCGLDPLEQLDAAVGHSPANAHLHRLRIATLLEARRHTDAAQAVAKARQALGDEPWLALLAGHIASELGDIEGADELFGSVAPPATREDAALFARHALRAQRPEDAAALLEPRISDDRDHLFWPYLSLAWRLLDDPRHDWLEGDERLVGVYDLRERIGGMAELAAHLRALHIATDEPLDQSVRGGTQTDGNLLLRDEGPIRALRALLLETVARHVEGLPEAVDGHPSLPRRRQPQRIAGSWSVRLRDAGFHADHVHSRGWLSSAFYVALPDAPPVDTSAAQATSGTQGWLSLGECRDLVPGLEPVRFVEPRPGRLVLFPSTMWHGTRPFPSGERMTVAFDIALPKQK